jgi:hypothetical protein
MSSDFDAFPDELRERDQWVMWSSDADAPRRPLWRGSTNVSWNDPNDWHSFEEAAEAESDHEPWGIGYVFANTNDDHARGLYGALDLDGCVDEHGRPKDWLPSLQPFFNAGAYMEYSPSDGIHIPVAGFEPPEWWSDQHFTDEEHEGAEAYGSKFFTVTGDQLRNSGDTVVDAGDWLYDWLAELHEAITGEDPRAEAVSEGQGGGKDDQNHSADGSSRGELGIYDVLSRSEYPTGENAAHPFHPSGTGKNFKVMDGGDSWRCWRHDTGGHAIALVGQEAGLMDCSDNFKDLSNAEQRDVYDNADELGYDVGDRQATDGGTAAAGASADGATSDEEDESPSYGDVFADVISRRGLNPARIQQTNSDDEDGDTDYLGVWNIVAGAESLGEAIMRYRRYSGQHDAADTKRIIAGVVVHSLRERGRILAPRGESPYYFYRPESRVYRLTDDEFYGLLEAEYDIADDREGKLVLSRIERVAARDGEQVDVHRVGFWNDETGALCVHDRAGGYFEVSADDINHHENGADGVFFLPAADAEPIEYVPADERDSLDEFELPGELPGADDDRHAYRRTLVNRANVKHGGGLSASDQRALIDLYLHALPFMNRIPEKPILAFTGVKESGKTASMRAIGQFINGTQWDVRVHADEEDFWAAVSNNAVVAYDQLDSQPPWLNDGLAAVATGTTYTKRKLYTTNDEATYRPRSWLAVNSRDPHFTRDDVASRLLILQFDQLSDKYGRRSFLAPLHDHYEAHWSSYLDRLQEIVAVMAGDSETEPSAFRMADWASVARDAAEPLGYNPEYVDAVIDRLKDQQAAFALESEPTYQALQALARETGGGTRYTAADLHDELEDVASDHGLGYDRTSSKSLATWIRHHRPELEATLGFTVHEGSSTKQSNEYQVPATGQQSL